MHKRPSFSRYHIYLLLAGMSYSSLSLFSAILTAQHIHLFTQLFYRIAFAIFFSWIVGKVIFHASFSLQKKYVFDITVNAILLLFAFTTFATSIYLGTPIAKAIVLMYSYPLPLIFLSALLLRHIPTRQQIIAIVVSLISLSILLEVWTIENISAVATGDIFALINATCFAGIIVWGRKLRDRVDLVPIELLFFSLLFMLPGLFILGFLFSFLGIMIYTPTIALTLPYTSWLPLAGLGLIGTVCSYMLFYLGIGKVKPIVAGTLLLSEPVWTYIWGILFFGQQVSIWTIVGGIGIFLAVLLT